MRKGVFEAHGKLESDLSTFFLGLKNVGNTLGGSFKLVRRAAELQERALALSWQVSNEERGFHRVTARVANSFAVTDPGLLEGNNSAEEEEANFAMATIAFRARGGQAGYIGGSAACDVHTDDNPLSRRCSRRIAERSRCTSSSAAAMAASATSRTSTGTKYAACALPGERYEHRSAPMPARR